jgi:hypothetical protein
MREAHAQGARFIVFPELALTTFFPRWWLEDQPEVDRRFFESAMPSPVTQPLFDEGRRLGVGYYIGYGERTEQGGRIRPEAFRVLALQGADLVALGFNTPTENLHYPGPPALRVHHHLIMAQSM